MFVHYCDVSAARTPKVQQAGTLSDWIKPFDLGKLCSTCLLCV